MVTSEVTTGALVALSNDPAKRERQLANLRRGGPANAGSWQPGQSSPNLRHGLHTRPPEDPGEWRLQILSPAAQELLEALAEAAPVRDAAGDVPIHDRLAIEAAAVDLIIVRRCLGFLVAQGFEDSRGNQRPEVDGLGRANERLMKKLDRLGMTPASRAKLGLAMARTADLATAMSERDPARRAELMAEAGVPIDVDGEEAD